MPGTRGGCISCDLLVSPSSPAGGGRRVPRRRAATSPVAQHVPIEGLTPHQCDHPQVQRFLIERGVRVRTLFGRRGRIVMQFDGRSLAEHGFQSVHDAAREVQNAASDEQ